VPAPQTRAESGVANKRWLIMLIFHSQVEKVVTSRFAPFQLNIRLALQRERCGREAL
jgi:hypothetical protein